MSEDSNQLVETPAVSVTNNPVTLLEQALAKGVDTETLQKFMDLQERHEANEARKAFAAAMVRCQKEMPAIQNASENKHTQSMYAKLEHINAGITPIYTKHGFSISFSEGVAAIPEMIRANCVIRHKFGHTETHFIDMPLDLAGSQGTTNKTPIQAKKSSFTYACRTLVCMLFNLTVGDDVDGNLVGAADLITEEEALTLEAYIKDNRVSMDALMRKFRVKELTQITVKDLPKWNDMVQQVIASRA